MASSASALASLTLDHDAALELEPLRDGGDGAPPQRAAKRTQRKNVLIINFLAVLLTLGIFSILVEYTAIADRARVRTSGLHPPSHLARDGDNANVNGGATHLYASVVDVYEEGEEGGENDDEEESSTPLPSFAHQQNLPLDELLQLNQLFSACMMQSDSLVDGTPSPSSSSSFPFSLSKDAPTGLLLKTLRACPDVDVFVPAAVRGDNEYCQDAAVYTKFLQSRMLPRWVLDLELRDESTNASVTYFDLCPKTPMLFLNHHWDALPSHPKWPSRTSTSSSKKPVYLMPNIDSTELERSHLLGADVVLCKTKTCFSRVSAWFAQEAQRGNTRAMKVKVLYTRHTSPNPSVPLQVDGVAIQQKDYASAAFVHFASSSRENETGDLKGTRQVLDCWLARRDLPPLQIIMDGASYAQTFKHEYDARIRSSENVGLVDTQPSASSWNKVLAEATFVLAPSVSESFGHTINQARATGGVVISTGVAPMNELLPSAAMASMELLVRAKRRVNPQQFLGSGFQPLTGKDTGEGLQGGKGLVAEFAAKQVCDAVDALVLRTQEPTRQALGIRAHRQYVIDMHVFAGAMAELRAYAVAARSQDAEEATDADRDAAPKEGVQRLGNLRVDTAAFSSSPPLS